MHLHLVAKLQGRISLRRQFPYLLCRCLPLRNVSQVCPTDQRSSAIGLRDGPMINLDVRLRFVLSLRIGALSKFHGQKGRVRLLLCGNMRLRLPS